MLAAGPTLCAMSLFTHHKYVHGESGGVPFSRQRTRFSWNEASSTAREMSSRGAAARLVDFSSGAADTVSRSSCHITTRNGRGGAAYCFIIISSSSSSSSSPVARMLR